MQKWLKASSLSSSYFFDVPPFARFIGLIDDQGPTDLWGQLRDDGLRDAKLTEALRSAYEGPLEFLGIEIPVAADASRIAGFIRTHEGVSADDAQAAAATLIAAYDVALGRSAAEPERPAPRTTAPRESRKVAPTPPTPRVGKPRDDGTGRPRGVNASLAVNIQIVLPADATEEKYDAILGAVAKHLSGFIATQ
jgi:hypothetical protein